MTIFKKIRGMGKKGVRVIERVSEEDGGTGFKSEADGREGWRKRERERERERKRERETEKREKERGAFTSSS